MPAKTLGVPIPTSGTLVLDRVVAAVASDRGGPARPALHPRHDGTDRYVLPDGSEVGVVRSRQADHRPRGGASPASGTTSTRAIRSPCVDSRLVPPMATLDTADGLDCCRRARAVLR